MKVISILLLAAVAMLTATPAYAYVDPGTGGMLIQLVTGGVAGLFVLVRLYWARIKESFSGHRALHRGSREQSSSGAAKNDHV